MSQDEPLEVKIAQRLTQAGKTLAPAESCTGGLIAHRITNVPGASAFFEGAVVAYSNAAKVAQLSVAAADLAQHGAVSTAVATAMAHGVRTRLTADYAIAVTGIAGPSGGTADKPVGLVFVAVANAEDVQVERFEFEGGREAIKEQTADAALTLLWGRLA